MTRPMVLRSVGWRGDATESAPFVGQPPAEYADRYRVTGTLRVVPGPASAPDLEVITIVDIETRSEVTVRGEQMTLTTSDVPPEYVARLWRDARHLAGVARRRGRPPGLTDVRDDEQLRTIGRELRAQDRRPTLQAVAAYSGTFTYSALRNYLRINGRKLSEIIDT
jgi:hypothetical protein